MYIHIYVSEVGGSEFNFRQAPVTRKSFSVVCACARCGCQVEMLLR